MNPEHVITVVYGPPGSGKTANAERLKEHFGCTQIVDSWSGLDATPMGSLVLTNLTLDQLSPGRRFRLISIEDALAQLEMGQ